MTDSIGKKLPTFEQMSLKNGQHIKTEAASYAWVNMDDSKTAKLGQLTDVDISQQKDDLEIRLNAGDLLVHVAKKIDKNATVKIRTGGTVTGITGTDPQIKLNENGEVEATFLTGRGNMAVSDAISGERRSFPIAAGQTAVMWTDRSAGGGERIIVYFRSTTEADITSSTMKELQADPQFAQAVQSENPDLDVLGLVANADAVTAGEEQNAKQKSDEVASGIRSDNKTVNNQNQETKEAERKAAEEAKRKHSDDDDDDEDEDTACEHEWSFNLAPNNLGNIGSVILLYVTDRNQSPDSDPIAVQLTGNNDDPVLRGSVEALAKCEKCGTSQTFTVQISVDQQSRRYTFSNTQCGYSTTGLVPG